MFDALISVNIPSAFRGAGTVLWFGSTIRTLTNARENAVVGGRAGGYGKMKILIIGSLYFCVDVNLKDRVIAACRELGTEIARKGHTIIVGSDNAKTVDLYVVQGANLVPKKQKLIVHLPERDDAGENRRIAPFSHQRAEFPNITEISYRASKGPWSVGRTYAIREADVVIVIGGARGAAQVGYSASALNKPVLAIPYFGGSAVEIWDTISPY